MEQVTTATNVVETSPGSYSASINGGNIESGFFREGNDQHGRGYKAIMVEVEKGDYQEYVKHVATPEELLAQTDSELMALSARTLEDILSERIESGKFVNGAVKDKITQRKALRASL